MKKPAQFMGYITEGAKRMRRLIVDLLSYSRAGRNIQMASLPPGRAA